MAVLVTLPNLGEQDAVGVVAEWYQPDGASVDVGEVVCRVESSFVAFDLEADGPGLLYHRVPAGTTERSGAVIADILERGETLPESEGDNGLAPIEVEWPFTPAEFESPVEEVAEPMSAAFEDQLVQSVVVPFPGAFAGTASRAVVSEDTEPVAFDPSLFGEAEHQRTTTLIEPGGSIPGLPLWEPEDVVAAPTRLSVAQEPHARFSRISEEATSAAQVLIVSVGVELVEAHRMRTAFERDRRNFGAVPLLEDIVFRALAMAIDETAFAGGNGAMLIATPESDHSFALSNPAALTFREAVAARIRAADEAFESASWILVSLHQLGVSSATSRLGAGHAMSFALAAADDNHRASLTMSYDSALWSEGSAARLLARVRDILHVPYTMLS